MRSRVRIDVSIHICAFARSVYVSTHSLVTLVHSIYRYMYIYICVTVHNGRKTVTHIYLYAYIRKHSTQEHKDITYTIQHACTSSIHIYTIYIYIYILNIVGAQIGSPHRSSLNWDETAAPHMEPKWRPNLLPKSLWPKFCIRSFKWSLQFIRSLESSFVRQAAPWAQKYRSFAQASVRSSKSSFDRKIGAGHNGRKNDALKNNQQLRA